MLLVLIIEFLIQAVNKLFTLSLHPISHFVCQQLFSPFWSRQYQSFKILGVLFKICCIAYSFWFAFVVLLLVQMIQGLKLRQTQQIRHSYFWRIADLKGVFEKRRCGWTIVTIAIKLAEQTNALTLVDSLHAPIFVVGIRSCLQVSSQPDCF